MSTEKEELSGLSPETIKLIKTLRNEHPDPQGEALELIKGLSSSQYFEVCTPQQREDAVEFIQYSAQLMQSMLY